MSELQESVAEVKLILILNGSLGWELWLFVLTCDNVHIVILICQYISTYWGKTNVN